MPWHLFRFGSMILGNGNLKIWATVRSLNQYLAFVSNDGWLMNMTVTDTVSWHLALRQWRPNWSANQMLTPLRLTLPGGATEYIWNAPLNPCGRHNWRFSQSLQYKLDWSSDCEPPCWPPCLPPCPPSCRPPCHHHVGHHVHLHVGHHVGQFRLGDISNQCHSLYVH